MSTETLVLAKQQLRMIVRDTVKKIPEKSIISQSQSPPAISRPTPTETNYLPGQTIFETLKTFPPYVTATSISIFISMPTGEIKTAPIVLHALSNGKSVYIPYLHAQPPHLTMAPRRVMDMVKLRDLADYEGLMPDKWGIPSVDCKTVHERERVLGETTEGVDLATLDLVLVPGVAFDGGRGEGVRRMGYGRGFYDLFFERYMGEGRRLPVPLWGLGLKEQYLKNLDPKLEVPMDTHDKVLNGVILGDGSIIM